MGNINNRETELQKKFVAVSKVATSLNSYGSTINDLKCGFYCEIHGFFVHLTSKVLSLLAKPLAYIFIKLGKETSSETMRG